MKVALVIGAARGIGAAIADTLADDHDVANTWLTTKPSTSSKHFAIQADLTRGGDRQYLFGECDAPA